MLNKRLIGVVTVKNGWAVQSLSYRGYLPLGKPECMVENLDRWGADEILIQVIDRSSKGIGPDYELLGRIGELGLKTPLIYAGGIRTVSDGVKLIQLGADRIVVDALLHDNLDIVKGLSDCLGAQALIASLPLSWQGNYLEWLNYRFHKSAPIPYEILNLLQSGVISETLISDWIHEGIPNGFDQNLINKFPLNNVSVILFGGLSSNAQIRELLQNSSVTAVAIGNFLSYREHALQIFKEALTGLPLRPATYESIFSLMTDV